jgi:raffinose/stachyose/melibiose transport system substrate-binding protein
MKMKNTLVAIGLASALLVAFSACGSGNSATPPTSGEAPGATASEPAGSSGQSDASTAGAAMELSLITPTIYTTAEDDAGQIASFERSTELLKQNFPNVKFTYEEYPHSTYEDKVKSLAAANSLPDLFILKSTMVRPLVDAGQIISFNDALDADPAWRDNFKAGMFVEAAYQDQIWAIPEYSSMNGILYYNKELLAQLGFDAFPATMDELWNLIDAANDANIIPIAAGSIGGWEAFSLFQNGLLYRYTGSQWVVDLMNRKEGVSFTDQNFIDAAAAGQNIAMNGGFNEDWYEIGHDEAIALFTSEQALMTFSGSWVIATITSSSLDDSKVGLAAMPKAEGYPDGDLTIHGSTGWMLFASASCDGEKYDPAIDFIKNMSNAKYASTRMEASSFPAMDPDAAMDASKISPLAIEHDQLVSRHGQSLVIDCVMDPQIVESLYQNTVALYLGNMTPEDFAQKVETEYEAVKAAS